MDDDIRNWLREEEYITFLAKRRKGDPLPQGVVADNPFSSSPWDYPEDSWYFFEENHVENNWEGSVRRTESGFWKWSSAVTIPTESVLGFRNVFEFFQGSTLEGSRTGWMMHQYHAGPSSEVAYHAQDDSSLCRLFWNENERVHSSQPNNSSAAFVDFHTFGSDIIVRKEESGGPSRREADGRSLINDCYDDFIEMKDLVSFDGETRELYNGLSDRSYIEFDDLLTSDSVSTSSGDSSGMSGNCDEYFNIDDLLGEIARDASEPVEDERNADCFSSFTRPVEFVLAGSDKQLKASMSPDKVNSKRWNHLSGGDYLELRDLLPSSRATTSGNLGCKSSSLRDFYFNVDELHGNIARDCSASVKEDHERPDCGLCIKKNYTPSESVASCIGNIGVANENEQSGSLEGPSKSGCSHTGQVKRNRSEGVSNHSNSRNGSSNDSSSYESSSSDCNGSDSSNSDGNGCNSTSKTLQSRRRKPGKRLAKIGKFFCLP